MNHSGDAAEQIVQMTLEGVEVAARITGTAAKEIALFLLAALKSPEKGKNIKLKGKERLNSMLKSGKALEIFSIKGRDLQTFVREAKRYGIVYCVLRNSKQTPDSLCDIMVKADDAPKINRLVERFEFATIDKAKIESEIVQDMAEQGIATPAEPSASVGAQPGEPEINDVNKLLDDLLGTDEGKVTPEAEKTADDIAAPGTSKPARTDPATSAPKKSARTAKNDAPAAERKQEPDPLASGGRNPQNSQPPQKTSPSGLSSDTRRKSEKPIMGKPSVRGELREITAAKKAKEAEVAKTVDTPTQPKVQTTNHKQPKNRHKTKSKKAR